MLLCDIILLVFLFQNTVTDSDVAAWPSYCFLTLILLLMLMSTYLLGMLCFLLCCMIMLPFLLSDFNSFSFNMCSFVIWFHSYCYLKVWVMIMQLLIDYSFTAVIYFNGLFCVCRLLMCKYDFLFFQIVIFWLFSWLRLLIFGISLLMCDCIFLLY